MLVYNSNYIVRTRLDPDNFAQRRHLGRRFVETSNVLLGG